MPYSVAGTDICVANMPPLASLAADIISGAGPLTVNFDASGSTTPNSGAAVSSYTFDFGDGSAKVTQASPMISHTYTANGTFKATVTVTDSTNQTSINDGNKFITVSATGTTTGGTSTGGTSTGGTSTGGTSTGGTSSGGTSTGGTATGGTSTGGTSSGGSSTGGTSTGGTSTGGTSGGTSSGSGSNGGSNGSSEHFSNGTSGAFDFETLFAARRLCAAEASQEIRLIRAETRGLGAGCRTGPARQGECVGSAPLPDAQHS